MLFSLLSGGNLQEAIISLLLTLPVIVLALCIHETAHGYIAWKCGDPTAYNLGRLTLNPVKHLDPIGFLSMLVFGYGWAKPVPVNTRNFRNPKRGMLLTGLAGPLSNGLLGLFSALLFGVFFALYTWAHFTGAPLFLVNVFRWSQTFFSMSALINFIFMGFNMIPVPPFDGSRVLLAFLPAKTYFGIMRYERHIMFGILIVMLLLSRFGISPFGMLAEWLTYTVAQPIANGMVELLLH